MLKAPSLIIFVILVSVPAAATGGEGRSAGHRRGDSEGHREAARAPREEDAPAGGPAQGRGGEAHGRPPRDRWVVVVAGDVVAGDVAVVAVVVFLCC